MAVLDLTTEEQEILARALESYLSNLRMEISNTENKSFRDGLKNEAEVLERLLGTLR